ncbi:winged helix-turn-helix transcriptional regulator [Magnetovibrio sp. PR-2]|uniref:winged helix-turn-helix transcriptional regulator n=1 Tax=Magnetovibrio sp. PR-2 TaxID=3120356 RepID=UPI002FCE3FF7
MTDSRESQNSVNFGDQATLDLLSTLEEDQHVSQRSLATRMGVALGMANGLLKRSVRKGLIKVQQAPAKRYAYYVTPQGFAEKSRLVADYLAASLSFFRKGRNEYTALFEELLRQNKKKAVLYGAGELAEIAMLSAQETGFELVGVVAEGSNQSEMCGLKVVQNADEVDADALVITCREQPQQVYDDMCKVMGKDTIYAVPLLHVRQQAPEEDKP